VRADLPTGTVTFLFTDIEGSTRLIEELGEEAYVGALAEHRRLLREAFTSHGGVEVDTQGDAFLYAFADAAAAVAAGLDGQQALAAGPVRVRIGLHTGEPVLTGEGYAGRELHRAARIAAVGHGGQVLLSAATAALVEESTTELGEHRLKDFANPVELFQLGAERFPPLKTVANTNLPRPASSFIGRERETAEVAQLVRQRRLVTLSGPGGSGKTRLAIEAAAELIGAFKAGVFWVGLATVRQPSLVLATVSGTLGASVGLAEYVGEREMLLLLDNLEQVIECASELASLAEACPNLHMLVTSRELLRVRGEVEYPVPPLAEPEAVALFSERAGLAPDETLGELCRRLDNLPLAVELAAARTAILTPTQILERLAQRLDLFEGGRDSDARQRTLRATIEWSHDLLDDDEKRLFACLAVFEGGGTLDAVEEVACGDLDTLHSLVDKSLLRHRSGRFWMLETIREFALEKLGQSLLDRDMREEHAAYFLGWAAEAGTRAEESIDDAATVFRGIDAELPNIRSAIDWRRAREEQHQLLEVVSRLTDYAWNRPGGDDLLSVVEEIDPNSLSEDERLRWLGLVSFYRSWTDPAGADEAGRAFLKAAEARGDPVHTRDALTLLGISAMMRGELEASEHFFREANPLLERDGLCWRNNLAAVLRLQGRLAEAADELAFQISFYEAHSSDFGVAVAQAALAEIEVERANPARAVQLLHAGLPQLAARGGTNLDDPIRTAAKLALAAGDAEVAAVLLGAFEAMANRLLHARDRAELDDLAAAIATWTGEGEYQILHDQGSRMTSDEVVERIQLVLDQQTAKL